MFFLSLLQWPYLKEGKTRLKADKQLPSASKMVSFLHMIKQLPLKKQEHEQDFLQ